MSSIIVYDKYIDVESTRVYFYQKNSFLRVKKYGLLLLYLNKIHEAYNTYTFQTLTAIINGEPYVPPHMYTEKNSSVLTMLCH